MKTTVVRYQAKPERADENQRLIEAVFAELDERELEGFTYSRDTSSARAARVEGQESELTRLDRLLATALQL